LMKSKKLLEKLENRKLMTNVIAEFCPNLTVVHIDYVFLESSCSIMEKRLLRENLWISQKMRES